MWEQLRMIVFADKLWTEDQLTYFFLHCLMSGVGYRRVQHA